MKADGVKVKKVVRSVGDLASGVAHLAQVTDAEACEIIGLVSIKRSKDRTGVRHRVPFAVFFILLLHSDLNREGCRELPS